MLVSALVVYSACAVRPMGRYSASVRHRTLTTKMQLTMSELPVKDISGQPVNLPSMARGKRVALYFTAGWCPMCLDFEPALEKYRAAAEESGNPVLCVMVSSDRSAADAGKRARALKMLHVEYDGSVRDALKAKYQIWAGVEQGKLGTGRRSGVPALVVIDEAGQELAFVDAERSGSKSLNKWPTDAGCWS